MMENNVVLFEQNAIDIMRNLSALKKQQEELKRLDDEARTALQKVMDEYGIKTFKNEYVTISNVAESTTTSLDTKKLEEKEPLLYEELLADYPKVTTKKSYVKILIK